MTFTQLAEKYIVNTQQRKLTFKRRIKNALKKVKKAYKYARMICRETDYSFKVLCQFFKYNSWTEIRTKNIIIPKAHVAFDVAKTGKIVKHGITTIGWKKIRTSKKRRVSQRNHCSSMRRLASRWHSWNRCCKKIVLLRFRRT